MTSEDDDPWQLRRALEGDEAAWAAIVGEFSTTIWHWARNAGLSRHDAEDVAQMVWYRLKDRGHTIRDPSRLAGWLARTTLNEAVAARSRTKRELGFDDMIATPTFRADARSQPDALALVGELRQQIVVAYAELRETCRELLALSWSGLSLVDIADALGRTPGYVGPTRMRCLKALRERAKVDG